ncbi:galactose/methyl galactoside import ATP-binding protein MglA [Clostridium acetireducens DSM 10703]|jgi:ABC-type uncharacterized transport system ATPase subunit|uniref:Galactose/methyl galactoside import ATP-binding protein MglA n=1 Tax=Clostridium acetireducens DSM 10703 TaxID=1121290 RepID=A0A1E8EZV5_9CLOT|nr:ABC transporter ATP-binding protein [Clostridium acetireducens]OFI06256.1 galactose/methyl galactoside import ATP-binding protein MglA [Clostridium acetireducens DSM 10703]
MSSKNAYVHMDNITKKFGKVVANNNVNLVIKSGEIHALLGENGAGKSTLMNMLSGIYTPDSGSIFIHGKEVSFSSPKDAIQSGIGMIYQHFKLVENMTAEQNIVLGQKSSLFMSKNKVRKKIKDICEKFSLEIDLDKMVYDMSMGEKEILQIIKVLYRGADILILDEPTTVFTPQETKKLFEIMKKMKENGCAVIFISHKLDEVMGISDRITVLRKGETIKTVNKSETNPDELVELMVGRSVDLSIKKVNKEFGNKVLEIKNLNLVNDESIQVLKSINLDIYSGEVLGIAGIAGSGQKELCESIAGIQKVQSGEIFLEGENLVGKNPRDIIKKGVSMSFVPEDRLGMGLVASMNMVDNLLLKSYHNQKGMLIRKKDTIKKAEKIKESLNIQTPNIYYPIKNLSGGNIQKILLGRELDSNPHLLIMAYPVRGLDVNTCYTIYDLINQQKQKGVSVLFIGEDLDVLINLCDRIAVMCGGEIMDVIKSKNATKEKLGLLMAGKKIESEGTKVD